MTIAIKAVAIKRHTVNTQDDSLTQITIITSSTWTTITIVDNCHCDNSSTAMTLTDRYITLLQSRYICAESSLFLYVYNQLLHSQTRNLAVHTIHQRHQK